MNTRKRKFQADDGTTEKAKKEDNVVVDIDSANYLNGVPFNRNCCYAKDIYAQKFRQEVPLILNTPVFGTLQVDIGRTLHGRVCNLISEICVEENIPHNTMILSLHLLDQSMASRPFKRPQLAVLACTCLFMACKVEEIFPPFIERLVYFSGKKFEKEEVLIMERQLLALWRFNVHFPTRSDFAERFAEAGMLLDRERAMVRLLLELSFTDYNFNYYARSLVAAAAIHLSMQIFRPKTHKLWTPALQHYSGYPESQLVEPVLRLRALHWNGDRGPMRGIFERHADENYSFYVNVTPGVAFHLLRFDTVTIPTVEEAVVLPDWCGSVYEPGINLHPPTASATTTVPTQVRITK